MSWTAGAAVAVVIVLMMMGHRLLLDVGCKHAVIPGIVLLIVGRRRVRLPVLHVAPPAQNG